MSKAARIRYLADGDYVDKKATEFSLTQEVIEKLDSIEPSAERNAIQGIKVNGQLQEPDQYRVVSLAIPEVEDNLDSISSTNALSAKQGRVLYNRIKNLEGLGKFLSNWDSTTGLPTTNPTALPYDYHSGDYYIVARVGATNYRPEGTSYRGIPSTDLETEEVKVGDFYFFNGATWELLLNTDRKIPIDESLSTTSTNPVENRVVTGTLNLKANDADISVVGKTNDYNDLDNLPTIPDSLDDLAGTSDDITEGNSHLFLTTSERGKLAQTSGVNTGDETNASIMSKLGVASSTTNGYLTASDWNKFNDKQAAISDLETIRSNAQAGKDASDAVATYGDIVTHDANEFATASQGGKADTALQPGDNVSELTNDAGYVTDAYHDSTKQDTLVAGNNIQIAADGVTISATDTTYVAGDFDIKDLADTTGLRAEWSGKQDELIAGNNIQIAADGKTISATDTIYTAGPGISISANNVISANDNKATWGSIEGTLSDQADLRDALDAKQNNLTAGNNVQIVNDTISATDTTYTAGTGISISANNVISNTQTSAEWGNIQGNIEDQTDLQTALADKQDALTAGANVQINGRIISATDTTYTAGDFDIKDLADSLGKRATWDAKQNALTAGDNIQIVGNEISATDTTYEASDFDIKDLTDSTGLRNTWSDKQNKLTAGNNIQITGNTISATDTTYDASDFDIKDLADSTNLRTTWDGKQDAISDLSTIRSGASKGATAIQPGGDVSDLTNDAGYITKSVNNLDNYYTKSETYTRAEVQDMVANFAGFKVVATLPTSDIKTNIIYLLGPVGTGADKYEEYIYSDNTWIKIGETTVDLSSYYNMNNNTSDDITQGSTNLFLTSAERAKLSNTSGTNTGDETKSTIQSKLGAASASNNGYLSSTAYSTFAGKQDAISDLSTIRSNATAGKGASDTIATYGDIVTHNVDEFATASQGALADTALQSGDNVSTLTNDAGYITASAIPTLDTAMSDTSIKGVQNKVIKSYVDAQVSEATAGAVSDVIYGSSWNGITGIAPSKNVVYDKISAMDTAIAGKQEIISDLATIRSDATAGKNASDTIANYGDIVSHNASEFLTTSKISNTAYGTSWNGVTDTAPSKDAVYDKLNAMDNTISGKQNTISDLSTIRSGAAAGATAVQSGDLGTVATTNDYNDLDNLPTIPSVGNGTVDIQKNGTSVGTFTLNQSGNKTINLSIPTTAADVSALPSSTKYGASLSLTMDTTNYKVTATLKDQSGNTLGTAQTIDLPMESVVVSGSYDASTKKVVLTLQSGSTIEFSIADLISGLQPEITSTNKLSADLITDGTTNKTVTATEKSTWNGKQNALTAGANISISGNTISATDTTYESKAAVSGGTAVSLVTTGEKYTWNNKQAAISDLATIRSNATAGAGAATTIAGYGDIVTHDVSEFATAAQGTKADTAVQPGDLADVAATGSYTDLTNKPTIPTVNNGTLTVKQNGTSKGTFTANQSGASTIELTDTTYSAGNGINITNTTISTASIYGTSSTAAATVEKVVSIPAITELNAGQVIIVHPTTTSSVASSTIKLNSFDAYPMRYNNAAITTSTNSVVWNAKYLSMFMFDGTYWQFLGHGLDSNTTYSNMSATEANTGTATNARTISASVLKGAIETHAPVSSVNGQTGAVTLTIPTVNNGTLTINQGGTSKGTFTANQSSASTVNLETGKLVTQTEYNNISGASSDGNLYIIYKTV